MHRPQLYWRYSTDKSAGGFDAAVHISEEASNATRAVPMAMIAAPCVAAICGFGKKISLLTATRLTG